MQAGEEVDVRLEPEGAPQADAEPTWCPAIVASRPANLNIALEVRVDEDGVSRHGVGAQTSVSRKTHVLHGLPVRRTAFARSARRSGGGRYHVWRDRYVSGSDY